MRLDFALNWVEVRYSTFCSARIKPIACSYWASSW
jgi:hypothetical protein